MATFDDQTQIDVVESANSVYCEPVLGSHQRQSPEAVALTICTTLDVSVTIQQLSMIITQRTQLN